MKDRLNLADFAVFNFKQLGNLPSPIDVYMIEKAESEDDSSLTIHRHKAPIADPRYDIAK